MNDPKANDPLSRTLASWRVTPRRDPQFRAATWARINESRKVGGSWWDYARGHRAVTMGLTVLALVVGGWVGREQARTRANLDRAMLAESYVRSLDARTMQMP